MRRTTSILLLFFFVFVSYSQSGDYKFRRLNASDGLSNNQVRSICVDRSGFAWFGTVLGLNRFDGNTIKVFKNIPSDTTSIPFNTVYRIYEDYKGWLWMWSADGVLTIYNPENETFNNDHELFHLNIPIARSFISSLLVDKDSNMWISNSRTGVYRYSCKSNHVDQLIRVSGDLQSLVSNEVTGMSIDSKSNIWIVNQKGIVEKIDPMTLKVIDRVTIVSEIPNADEQINFDIFIDKDDDLWVYSQNYDGGVYFYSPRTKNKVWLGANSVPTRLTSNIVSGVNQDDNGIIWISTDHGGINLLDKRHFSVSVLQNEPGVANSLGQNSITSLYKDRSGIMWVGTYKNGLSFYHPSLFQFKLFRNDPLLPGSLPSNDIDCFAEDQSGNLWIGTNGNGLIYYNRLTNSFKTFQHNSSDPNSLSNDVIVSLRVDNSNRLWIGTYYGGLNMYDGKRFKRFYHDANNPKTIADNRIWHIYQDSKRQLWIATLGGGLDLYDERNERFIHYKTGDVNSIHSDFVLVVDEEKEGDLLIGTSSGLDVLNPTTGRFSYYSNIPNDENSLSNNVVLSILQDKRGWIWIGTRNGLNCFDVKSKKFRRFGVDDGLPEITVLSILEDSEASLWMSTLDGICNLRVLDGDSPLNCKVTIRNFSTMDGLQGKEFNEHSGFKTRKGEMLFGGANGFNLFDPSTIKVNKFAPVVAFTGFKLQNRYLNIGEEMGGRVILSQAINRTVELQLSHNQNVFTIEFSALHFLHPEKMKYKYKLEGFNTDWTVTDASNRQATYTNLNPGIYEFKVACTDVDGSWQDNFASIRILVIPPFYASKVAFFIYFLVLGLMVITLIRIIVRREQLKFQREQEKQEHQRMHELDNMKIKFFTNVSHEFRTPLTLILTPIEKLIKKAPDEDMRNQLILIQRNGRRLLNLVNQLLDFRKLEMQDIPVNLSYNNFIAFAQETAASFTDLSDAKDIHFVFSSSVGELFTWFDSDKIEKVIFNLLNNAFKFTPSGGSIVVTISVVKGVEPGDGNFIELKVKDTGIGISKDKQERIFERFFQAETSGSLMNQGSGIGLALTLEFVKLHKGTITVESEPEKGSTFIVMLPVLSDEMAHAAHHVAASGGSENTVNQLDADRESASSEKPETDKPTILLVEDNEDLRFYLKENLRQSYQIQEASNGVMAMELIAQKQPSLIVSDIMMLEMDGLELCRKLKSDPETSHIPIILLSARSTHDQKLEGLELGADEYITKPFNYEILELRIRKLIQQRRELQKSLHLHYEIKPGEIGVTSLDEKFLQKALSIVEKNISNTDYSVERMSKDLGVSRGHLYNKIMALTGKTPIEFIRIMRLKRAAQLLGKSQLTVAEIAFEVGFNDPKYFSKYFKDEFKMSPSEYAKKMMMS